MPRTPEQIARDTKMALQLAYQLGQLQKTGKYGPEAQAFYDFIDAVTTYGPQARENEALLRQKEWDARNKRRGMGERSMTRGQLLDRMGGYQNSLLFKLEQLGKSLHEGNYEKAKSQLPHVLRDMDYFAVDYERYKNAMPDLVLNDPVLEKFDRLYQEGEFRQGEELQDQLEHPEKRKPIQAQEEPGKAEIIEDEFEPLNINEQVIETQRRNMQLNTGRRYTNLYEAGASSYEGILGKCKKDAGADLADLNSLLAKALAAQQLRQEAAPFSKNSLTERTQEIQNSPGFPAMIKNKQFVEDCLSQPEKMDRTLKLYEQENKAAQRTGAVPKSYSEYFRLHSWPNVQPGREKEYLAKCIAANRLQMNQTPFDLETIRQDAEAIQNQASFQQMTKKGTQAETAEERVRRWLHKDEIVVADITLRDLRNSKLKKNMQEPDRTRKTWAGYRRMHTGENVPANAGREEKRLNLAKAMVAIRGMADDKPFSVKAARKAAAALVKNPYFRAITRDPEKVTQVLASGKVVDLFEEMANARKQALQAKQKQQEPITENRISLGESGLESSAEQETRPATPVPISHV